MPARGPADGLCRVPGEVLGSVASAFDSNCVILPGSVARRGQAWHDFMKYGWNEAVMPPVFSTPIGAAGNVVQLAYVASE